MTVTMHDDVVGAVPTVHHEDRAVELARAADARSAELDAACRIPDDLYRAAAAAGLFRQLVVGQLGGQQRAPLDWFRTGVELARHEASFGWVVTQGAVELGWISAAADESWARDVLADPLGMSASSVAGGGTLTIDGERVRLSGRWSFNTGCQGATWVGGFAVVKRSGADPRAWESRWGWVPADRAELIEDWDPSGLRGTGSHTTVIREQDIPIEWTFDPASPTPNDRGPHRCLVGNGYWPIATSVAATQLGNARRALDEARMIVVSKAPAPDFAPLAENPSVQHRLVEAEGLWQAAIAAVERELASMWEEATERGELTQGQRVRLHRANATANRLAVRAVDLACEITGTTSVARRHVLGRCLRDAYALRGHITTAARAIEHNARVDLGLSDEDVLV